jgi:elongator complex protein 3
MPEYVRIQRMQRDIPLHQIEAGLNQGNLRELVHRRMDAKGLRNPTIRFREIGHYQMRTKQDVDPENIQLIRRDYEAAGGTEIFLSYEDLDAHRTEISEKSFIIRELRVYGPVVDIGERDIDAWQHLGLGEKMISAATEIGKSDFDATHMLVNSGIGVKEYYRGLGFTDKGPYLLRYM